MISAGGRLSGSNGKRVAARTGLDLHPEHTLHSLGPAQGHLTWRGRRLGALFCPRHRALAPMRRRHRWPQLAVLRTRRDIPEETRWAGEHRRPAGWPAGYPGRRVYRARPGEGWFGLDRRLATRIGSAWPDGLNFLFCMAAKLRTRILMSSTASRGRPMQRFTSRATPTFRKQALGA